VLSGERVHCSLLGECTVDESVVTTTSSGFINGSLFKSWIEWFANKVPSSGNRPLVLVMDGYRSHYSIEVVEVAAHHIKLRKRVWSQCGVCMKLYF